MNIELEESGKLTMSFELDEIEGMFDAAQVGLNHQLRVWLDKKRGQHQSFDLDLRSDEAEGFRHGFVTALSVALDLQGLAPPLPPPPGPGDPNVQ